jgi:anti-sigma B factor antagonist
MVDSTDERPAGLTVQRLTAGATATLAVVGEIDAETCGLLADEICVAIRDGAEAVVVDLADVPFVDSAGGRTLAVGYEVAQAHRVAFQLVNAPRHVAKRLELVGVRRRLAKPVTSEQAPSAER